jgi:hypothetical protein
MKYHQWFSIIIVYLDISKLFKSSDVCTHDAIGSKLGF